MQVIKGTEEQLNSVIELFNEHARSVLPNIIIEAEPVDTTPVIVKDIDGNDVEYIPVQPDPIIREIDNDGTLLNTFRGRPHKTKTSTYDIVREDPVHGLYIIHPEKFRGRWFDNYIDAMIAIIPDYVEQDLNFTKTPVEIQL